MDVVCSEDIEFVHGGLHLQVTHHLFPRMPRHNLRKASLLVKEYCTGHDITYQEHGWIDGYVRVFYWLPGLPLTMQEPQSAGRPGGCGQPAQVSQKGGRRRD